MSIVTDFRSIRRKLERQEQKVEFEEKNPKPMVWNPEWGYGPVAVPFDLAAFQAEVTDPAGSWITVEFEV